MDSDHTKDADNEVKLAIKEAVGIVAGSYPEAERPAEKNLETPRRKADEKKNVVRDHVKT